MFDRHCADACCNILALVQKEKEKEGGGRRAEMPGGVYDAMQCDAMRGKVQVFCGTKTSHEEEKAAQYWYVLARSMYNYRQKNSNPSTKYICMIWNMVDEGATKASREKSPSSVQAGGGL